VEKLLGMSVDDRFNMNRQRAIAAQKANHCTKRSATSRSKEVILPLLDSIQIFFFYHSFMAKVQVLRTPTASVE